MTILGSQKTQHQKNMSDDQGEYTAKVYTLTVRLYSAGSTESEYARRLFENMLLNYVMTAGKGYLKVESLTD